MLNTEYGLHGQFIGVFHHDFERPIRREYRVFGRIAPYDNSFDAIWIFESRTAWERLWGAVDSPRAPADYPEKWKTWENEILAPLLTRDPDTIRFTSYLEV